MSASFAMCLPLVLVQEGAFVNNPQDPGGATDHGVTLLVWQSWVGHPVTVADIKALTVADVTPLYKVRYWNAVSCDSYPVGVALMVFDFAVNGGDGRSAKTLQKAVGVDPDGDIGQETLAAVAKYIQQNGASALVNDLKKRRLAFYQALANFNEFGRGWTNRVNTISTQALAWC